ncbi:MAG TPA: hypothetical protein DEP13_13115 [Gammaproteobacteria bacterium]|nr:hypothetical protein [Gammaproteobacteria bacterium]OUX33367.1 MAG: hypothetical protein CBE20_05100 [Gammaproteobacteria bacterium TMED260]HCA37562.1 hypothetical protein [Gammaproteobacteria bacterium]
MLTILTKNINGERVMIKKALLLAMAVTMTGCLVTVDSDSRPLQTVWNEGDVTRLQVGQSDEQWVRNSFGDPVTKLNYADGTEIWKYRNRSEKDTEVGLFLIFSVDVEEERVETLSIEFADGIVSNYWIEEERF